MIPGKSAGKYIDRLKRRSSQDPETSGVWRRDIRLGLGSVLGPGSKLLVSPLYTALQATGRSADPVEMAQCGLSQWLLLLHHTTSS